MGRPEAFDTPQIVRLRYSSAQNLGDCPALCTETVFLVLLLSMQESPQMKYNEKTDNSPLAAYSGLLWLRPCPEHD